MDEQHELERLQEQCRRFSYYHAMLQEDNDNLYQQAHHCIQNMALIWLLAAIQKDVFDLLQAPEEAKEIGADILELLYQFSMEYTNMLKMEYECCQMADGENSPLE